MAVKNSTMIVDSRELLSQTPPDFLDNNSYLKYNQYKVDADWDMRPNKKWIDVETEFGTENFEPIEVVIQSVRNETGNQISDDWYRIVFRDCFRTNLIGQRFRFALDPNPQLKNKDKNVWIGVNGKNLDFTSSIVARRCNGRIGSIYIDEHGNSHYHYEPVIQTTEDSRDFWMSYNQTVIDPHGRFVIIAQYNKYTAQYYINQRFIVGVNSVYKVNNITDTDSQSTNDPRKLGIIRIYLDEDQAGENDNFKTRIAYNGKDSDPKPIDVKDGYVLAVKQPQQWKDVIPSSGVDLKLQCMSCGIDVEGAEYSITAYFDKEDAIWDINDYIEITQIEDGYYHINRKKTSLDYNIIFECYAEIDGCVTSVTLTSSLRPF